MRDDPRPPPAWRRVLARVLDGVVVGVPFLIVSSLIGEAFAATYGGLDENFRATEFDPGNPELAAALTGVALVLLVVGYDLVMVATLGRTLGKIMLGIEVISTRRAGRPGFGAAAVRALIWGCPAILYALVPGNLLLAAVGAVVLLLNVLWPRWDRWRRRCLHDLAAGTMVADQSRVS